jgi:hypothetical protein
VIDVLGRCRAIPEFEIHDKMGKDSKFRAEFAGQIGLGFELPKVETIEVVPSVPRSQEMEVVVSD